MTRNQQEALFSKSLRNESPIIGQWLPQQITKPNMNYSGGLMIRCKEFYRSADRDDAITGLQKVMQHQYHGWSRGGDVLVTKKRSSGQTFYEATAVMVKQEAVERN
jgi:hypothetical protein